MSKPFSPKKILHSGRKIHLGDLLASPMMDASIASGNTRYSALEELFTKELLWWNEHFWCYCGSFLEVKTCLPIRLLQYKDKYLHVAIIQNLLLYFLIPKKNFCVGAGGGLFTLSNLEHFWGSAWCSSNLCWWMPSQCWLVINSWGRWGTDRSWWSC